MGRGCAGRRCIVRSPSLCVGGSDARARRRPFSRNGKSEPKWKREHPHIVRPLALSLHTTYTFSFFQNFEEIHHDSCALESADGTTPLLVCHRCSPVWALTSEGGHFLQKWKKCATFRLLRRYELHFARAVAFSFCEQNGKRAGRMENGGPLVQPVATTDTLRDRSAWSVLWADGGGRLAPPERRGREARHLSQEKGVCRSWRDPYGSVVDFWRCTTSFQLPKKLPHDVGRNLTERLADTVRQNAQ